MELHLGMAAHTERNKMHTKCICLLQGNTNKKISEREIEITKKNIVNINANCLFIRKINVRFGKYLGTT